MHLPSNPLLRPLLALLALGFTMHALRSTWSKRSTKGHTQSVLESRPSEMSQPNDRLVVAHFMLGNTYPYTTEDWMTTFDLAEDTALDGFALNLGPEEWQFDQAISAFKMLEARNGFEDRKEGRRFGMFLSLDMNVLPSSTVDEAQELLSRITELIRQKEYLRYRGGKVLSTFGGHEATFGGWGWTGFLQRLKHQLNEDVLFIPSFFMPPEDFTKLPYVDGCFPWNNAWPLDNHTIDLREDEPFMNSDKLYMAAVSPLFSTHYGTTGQWAFNKNWIYRSDDLLLPTRFSQLIHLTPSRSPNIIQVISWNDYGESHNIAPVLGAQPGSEGWTEGMDHIGFREMVRYFADVWRGQANLKGSVEVEEGSVRVWGWYRTHPAGSKAVADDVGSPLHSDWASDLLNFMILIPKTKDNVEMQIRNGERVFRQRLNPGKANGLTVPFIPGDVSFELQSSKGPILRGQGKSIDELVQQYNFNMWSGSWACKV